MMYALCILGVVIICLLIRVISEQRKSRALQYAEYAMVLSLRVQENFNTLTAMKREFEELVEKEDFEGAAKMKKSITEAERSALSTLEYFEKLKKQMK